MFLTESEVNERLEAVDARLSEIDREYRGKKFPDEVRTEHAELTAERDQLAAALDESRARKQKIMKLAANPYALERVDNRQAGYGGSSPAFVRGGLDPWDARSGPLSERAKVAANTLHRDGTLPDHAAERVTELCRHRFEGHAAQEWLVATSNPAYASAFARMLADPQTGYAEFDDAERAAWRQVRDVQRAMEIGTDAGGGFLVPAHLDPAIMLTSDGSVDPLRRIARTVQITTSAWNGVTSAGVTAEWLAEHAEAADGTPTLAQPSVPVHKGSAFVPFSVEYQGDAQGALSELGRLLREAADELQAEAHWTGTGAGQPTGFVTGLDAASKVATAAADTLAAGDVFGLQSALPPRWQPRAQWCSNLAVANDISQFETANGAKMFPEIANRQLLRKPWNEASHLDSPGDTAAAGNDNVLAYGDWRNYLIVDRVGTSVELIPHILGANRRPTGQRGLWLWFRTGADVLVDEAFRLLTA